MVFFKNIYRYQNNQNFIYFPQFPKLWKLCFLNKIKKFLIYTDLKTMLKVFGSWEKYFSKTTSAFDLKSSIFALQTISTGTNRKRNLERCCLVSNTSFIILIAKFNGSETVV